jgi:hypothetical protein
MVVDPKLTRKYKVATALWNAIKGQSTNAGVHAQGGTPNTGAPWSPQIEERFHAPTQHGDFRVIPLNLLKPDGIVYNTHQSGG